MEAKWRNRVRGTGWCSHQPSICHPWPECNAHMILEQVRYLEQVR